MRRPNQLLLESAVIASVMIMLTLGGSVATTRVPPSFLPLQNPGAVGVQHDKSALAIYYNTTQTDIGEGRFANASFLLRTFPFVNIAPSINGTALAANADLAEVNSSIPRADSLFSLAEQEIQAKEYLNASASARQGCTLALGANASLSDFLGPQTASFRAGGVPTDDYSKGAALLTGAVRSTMAECGSILRQVGGSSGAVPRLSISSPQSSIETGGEVRLAGSLTLNGTGLRSQEVMFYLDGSHFGTLETDTQGALSGTLVIPFVYTGSASVQAFVNGNGTLKTGASSSNALVFEILFNQTTIAIGDPPSVLPTFSFPVEGSLTTAAGSGLPDAPVQISFFNEAQLVHTDAEGGFTATLAVPANASDGVYDVYARFAPEGAYGPSFNFTSVRVVHLPLDLALSPPSITLAGLSATISGTASSNGTALANTDVTVVSPWGTSRASTNSAGEFVVTVPVSPLEFALERSVSLSVSSPIPYVASGRVVLAVRIINVLLVVLPAAAIGIVAYEADQLGVFESVKQRARRGRRLQQAAQAVPAQLLDAAEEAPEVVQVYRRAVGLAAARFTLRFRPSQTIREVASAVSSRADEDDGATFEEIMQAVEDALYSRDRWPAPGELEEKLGKLEGRWR